MNQAVIDNDPIGLVNLMVDSIPEENISRMDKLGRVKDLLSRCSTHITTSIAEESKIQTMANSKDGEVLHTIEVLAALEPRNKLKVVFRSTGLYFENIATSATAVTNHCFVKWSRIRNICLVPNTASLKKGGEDLVVLNFNSGAATAPTAGAGVNDEPVKFGPKAINNCLFPLSREEGANYQTVTIGGLPVCGSETKIVQELLAHCCPDCPIVRPQKDIFHAQSNKDSTWTYIRAFRGASEGCLYPLSSGILFIKPVLFIPTDDVVGITAGRAGSATTRYIDLKVDVENNTKGFEFSNIDRGELESIQSYVQYYVSLRKKQQKAEEKQQQQQQQLLEAQQQQQQVKTEATGSCTDTVSVSTATSGSAVTTIAGVSSSAASTGAGMGIDSDSDDSSDEDFDPDADDDSDMEGGSDNSDDDDDGSGSDGSSSDNSDSDGSSSSSDSDDYTDESEAEDEAAGGSSSSSNSTKFVIKGAKVSKCIDSSNILSSKKRKRGGDATTDATTEAPSFSSSSSVSVSDVKIEVKTEVGVVNTEKD